MTSLRTNKSFLKIFLIALLLVGLFYFLASKDKAAETTLLKPSQLNFAQSNELKIETPTQIKNPSAEEKPEDVSKLNIDEQNKIKILNEILRTKNDNELYEQTQTLVRYPKLAAQNS